jgi:hypothetical protein
MSWWNGDSQLDRAIVGEFDLLARLEASPCHCYMVVSMHLDRAFREG